MINQLQKTKLTCGVLWCGYIFGNSFKLCSVAGWCHVQLRVGIEYIKAGEKLTQDKTEWIFPTSCWNGDKIGSAVARLYSWS